MLRATAKSLWARKLRLSLSALAIVLGVAFVAGSLMFTAMLRDGQRQRPASPPATPAPAK